MNRKVILTIVIVLVLVAGAAGISFAAFRAGAAYGISQSPAVATALSQNGPNGDVRPFVAGPGLYGFGHPYMGWGMHGWGGFGLLQCLVPLFFLFLLFGLFRLIFRPWGWGWRHGWHGGPWGHGEGKSEGMPPMFEEWHKRAHGQTPPAAGDTPPSPTA